MYENINISTRAPREGSDSSGVARAAQRRDFYPRSPRGERHGFHIPICTIRHTFLPALPARGATYSMGTALSTRAISTRAPREGSDMQTIIKHTPDYSFLPALPARGATFNGAELPANKEISTRAPREGSDEVAGKAIAASRDFYPRSPRGERQYF